MIKRFVTLLLAVMATAAIQAQSIIGSWYSVIEDEGDRLPLTVTFTDKTINMLMAYDETDPATGSFAFKVEIPGTYTKTGNTISLTLDPKNANASLEKLEFNDEVKKMLDQNPDLKKQLEDTIKGAVGTMKEELVSALPFGGELTISKLTDTELTLTDTESDEAVTFTRVK